MKILLYVISNPYIYCSFKWPLCSFCVCSPILQWTKHLMRKPERKKRDRAKTEMWKRRNRPQNLSLWHMEAITRLCSHLCPQPRLAGTQKPLRRMGVIRVSMGLWWDLTRKRGRSRWIIMVQGEVQMFSAIYRKQVLRYWERFSKVTNSCFLSFMYSLPVMLVPTWKCCNTKSIGTVSVWCDELTVCSEKINQKANAR